MAREPKYGEVNNESQELNALGSNATDSSEVLDEKPKGKPIHSHKNSHNSENAGVNNFSTTRVVIGIVIVISISLGIRFFVPEFDLFGDILNGNGCIVNFSGSCSQIDGGGITPIDQATLSPSVTPTPTVTPIPQTPSLPPPTSTPLVTTAMDCAKPGLPSVQTDQIKLTINSVEIKRTNIDLNTLYIYVTVENLTNAVLKLTLHQNLRILASEPPFVIASPITEESTWVNDLSPSMKAEQTIKISQISDAISSIDIEFLNSVVGDKVESGIRINGIPSSCN